MRYWRSGHVGPNLDGVQPSLFNMTDEPRVDQIGVNGSRNAASFRVARGGANKSDRRNFDGLAIRCRVQGLMSDFLNLAGSR